MGILKSDTDKSLRQLSTEIKFLQNNEFSEDEFYIKSVIDSLKQKQINILTSLKLQEIIEVIDKRRKEMHEAEFSIVVDSIKLTPTINCTVAEIYDENSIDTMLYPEDLDEVTDYVIEIFSYIIGNYMKDNYFYKNLDEKLVKYTG